jgi:hypothetical protein
VKGLTIKGYPTVLFYAANNKTSPIKYTEKRTVGHGIEFRVSTQCQVKIRDQGLM